MNLVLGLSLESASKGPGLWKVNPRRAVSGCHYLRMLIGQKTLQFKAFHELLLLQYLGSWSWNLGSHWHADYPSFSINIHQYPSDIFRLCQWQCSLLDMKKIDDFMVSIFPGNLTVASDWRPPELQDLWPQAKRGRWWWLLHLLNHVNASIFGRKMLQSLGIFQGVRDGFLQLRTFWGDGPWRKTRPAEIRGSQDC